MAITAVDRIDHSSEITEKGTTCTETYRVQCDAVPSDVIDIATASYGGTSIPSIGTAWSATQTTIKCKKVGPVRKDPDSEKVYLVPCMYNNISGGSNVVTDNPLSRPADISWGFDVIEKVAEKDRDDNDIQNSAGDKFDPPVTKYEYRLLCTIRQNFSSLAPIAFYNYIDTVNSATVTIAGITATAGRALITDYSAEAIYEGTYSYVQRTIQIAFAPTHAVEVADMGYYYIDASDSSKRKRFVDDEGKPDTEPHWLTSGGDDGGTTARYLVWDINEESNFGSLGLPTTFPD